MEQRESSFFDPKTILAIIMVGGVWYAWQTYLTKKYPDYGKPPSVVAGAPTQEIAAAGTTTTPATQKAADAVPSVHSGLTEKVEAETVLGFENDVYSFQVSSHGMGLKGLTLKKFKNRLHQPVVLGESAVARLFEFRLNGQPVKFELSPMTVDQGKSVFVGIARSGDMKVKRTLIFDQTYSIRSELSFENVGSESLKSFQVLIPEVANSSGPGSIFAPATEIQEFVFGTAKTFERLPSHGNEPVDKSVGLFDVMGVASHYFVASFGNESEVIPEVHFSAKPGDKEVLASAAFKPLSTSGSMTFKASLFAGPKDLDTLQAASTIHTDLSPIVDFGFFGMIGKILLKVMHFFYNYTVPNWGVAIILLTLLVRAVVLPFNLASYKSMKKMQVIQPQITALRERHKEDPTTLNTEMMKLMKDQKVNPLGGCLPMFLQMPVFLALYQVLGQSVDLYQAPFFGWIQDLSLKDPYFVLPILMGISMWYNQKITPTTMDPTQAKVMQFLPLVFSFMMIALPSGLTLYIFVSTLFGIIQQQIFMKNRTTAA